MTWNESLCGSIMFDRAGAACREPRTHIVKQWVNYSRSVEGMQDRYVMVMEGCLHHCEATKAGLERSNARNLDLEARGEWHGTEPYRPSAQRYSVLVEPVKVRS